MESTKSVSDVYAPVAGVVVEVNAELTDAPALNEIPTARAGSAPSSRPTPPPTSSLLDADAYRQLIAQ